MRKVLLALGALSVSLVASAAEAREPNRLSELRQRGDVFNRAERVTRVRDAREARELREHRRAQPEERPTLREPRFKDPAVSRRTCSAEDPDCGRSRGEPRPVVKSDESKAVAQEKASRAKRPASPAEARWRCSGEADCAAKKAPAAPLAGTDGKDSKSKSAKKRDPNKNYVGNTSNVEAMSPGKRKAMGRMLRAKLKRQCVEVTGGGVSCGKSD